MKSSSPIPPGEDSHVILVHGLGRTRLSMRRLSNALKGAGYQTHNWPYNSRLYRLKEHINRFRVYLESFTGSEHSIHFVGHSLGALVIRGALSEPLSIPPGRIVMIAPPNQGASVAQHFGGTRIARWFFGKPVWDLDKDAPSLDWLGLPLIEYGIIAGSRRFHLLNPISHINALRGLELEHDGTVEIENTKLPGMKDFIIVTAHHSFICNHAQVICQTIAFLRRGGFERSIPQLQEE